LQLLDSWHPSDDLGQVIDLVGRDRSFQCDHARDTATVMRSA
jgi:hypothetical protein